LAGTDIAVPVCSFVDMFLSSPYHLSPTSAKPYFHSEVVILLCCLQIWLVEGPSIEVSAGPRSVMW
jgi:hypothetical protein